jgi:hypothetical protein
MTRTGKRSRNGLGRMQSRGVLVALLLWFLSGTELSAQTGPAVLLQVKPTAGDTIRVRLDQTVEMSGPAGADGRTPVESGTLVLLATLAVESVDLEGATIVRLVARQRAAEFGVQRGVGVGRRCRQPRGPVPRRA